MVSSESSSIAEFSASFKGASVRRSPGTLSSAGTTPSILYTKENSVSPVDRLGVVR